MLRDATISEDGKYRYSLMRCWHVAHPVAAFILLNPSTADAAEDDATIRKCMRLASGWGFGKIVVGNLFAFRSTDPAALKRALDPIGPENDVWLRNIVRGADVVVAGWGNHGIYFARGAAIRLRFQGKLQALRLTKRGEPSHPLYLPDCSKPFLLE